MIYRYLFLFIFVVFTNSQLYAKTFDFKRIIKDKFSKIINNTDTNESSNTKPEYTYKINSNNAEIYAVYNNSEFLDDDNINYKGIQGFTSDDKYFYVAILNEKDKNYIKQETKIIKIDIKTKKVVKQKHIGRMGHSSSLTYNPLNQRIYCCPASYEMPFFYCLDTDLNIIDKFYLKDKDNNIIKSIKRINTLAYDKTRNLYFTKVDKSNEYLFFFDSDFKFNQRISCSKNILKENTLLQAIDCDDRYVYVLSFVKNSVPLINNIRIFNLKNGKYIDDLILSDELAPNNEVIELEQITFANDELYALANIIRKNQFCIFKLNCLNNLKKANK